MRPAVMGVGMVNPAAELVLVLPIIKQMMAIVVNEESVFMIYSSLFCV